MIVQLAPDFKVSLKPAELLLITVFCIDRPDPFVKVSRFLGINFFFGHGIVPLGPFGKVDALGK